MSKLFGIDYAWGRIPGRILKESGIDFVCRYLSNDPSKNLTAPEVKDLHAAGVSIVLVWEAGGSAALNGYGQGAADAKTAHGQARKLGVPDSVPIYFAVDFPETAPEQLAVREYFRGAAGVLGFNRTGIYGGLAAVEAIQGHEARYAWQTYAWSGGVLDGRAQLYQFSNGHTVAGVSVDFNHSLADDFGQWAPPRPEQPHGVAQFSGSIDLASGRWTIKGERSVRHPPHFGHGGGKWEIRNMPAEKGDIWRAEIRLARGT